MSIKITKKNLSKKPKSALSLYAGKWVAFKKGKVIASGNTIKDIKKYVVREKNDKTPLSELPSAFKVPRKDEGPYVLFIII